MVCAPNAFKGALGAVEAAAAMAAGVLASGVADVVPVEVPIADGGDGTLDVLLRLRGGFDGPPPNGEGDRQPAPPAVQLVRVTGPLGDPVSARLGWLAPGEAVVELAEAAGLRLVAPGALDALRAATYGVGELLRAALDGGARRIVVGVGGSATTDGGAGMLAALGARLLDSSGAPLPPGGGSLTRLARLDLSGLDPRLRACRIEVAVDVRSPLLGPHGSAAVFGPQKSASPADVAALDHGLARLVDAVDAALGANTAARVGTPPARAASDATASPTVGARTVSDSRPGPPAAVARISPDMPGTGAAGGTAYALAAVCGAHLLPGAALVCDLVGLDAALDGAALALTGEGRLDASTAEGKAPAEVAKRSAAAGVPCVALAGSVEQPPDPMYTAAIPISASLPLAEAQARTADLLRAATTEEIRRRLKP